MVSGQGDSKPRLSRETPLKSDVFQKTYVRITLFIDKLDWDDLVKGNYEEWGDIVLRRDPLESSLRVEVRMKRLPKGESKRARASKSPSQITETPDAARRQV